MKESQFKKKLMQKLKTIPRSEWESINQISINGTADIIGCVAGRYVRLECKRSEKQKPTKLQEYKLKKFSDIGGISMLVYPENEYHVLQELFRLN